VAYFAADAAAFGASNNRAKLQNRANAFLTENAKFIALGAPTNAQTLAQVQHLTKECSALIRLSLALFDDITDTA
jgi:hypothetical protein